MADEEKKSKATEDEPKDAKAKDKDKGEGDASGEETGSKKKKGLSPLILIISAVVSLVIFVGVFSYMMGVFDPAPPVTEGEGGEDGTQAAVEDTLFGPTGQYHSDYGRAAAAVDASRDSGVVDTGAELSEIERARKELAADEARISEERRELVTLKQEVERLLSKRDGIADEKVLYTAKLLDGMKPEETARLIAELDNKMILRVLPKMKPQSASKLMAQLPPKRAAEITTELLQSDP